MDKKDETKLCSVLIRVPIVLRMKFKRKCKDSGITMAKGINLLMRMSVKGQLGFYSRQGVNINGGSKKPKMGAF